MERGFNAGQTHCSMYPSIFNRLMLLRDIDWKLQAFPIPLHLTPLLGVIPLDNLRDFWWASCLMARLQYSAKISRKS